MTDVIADLFDLFRPVLGALAMAGGFCGALTCSTVWMISKDTCRLKFWVCLNMWAYIGASFVWPSLGPSLDMLVARLSVCLLFPATAWLAFVGYRESHCRLALATAMLLMASLLIFISRLTYFTLIAGPA